MSSRALFSSERFEKKLIIKSENHTHTNKYIILNKETSLQSEANFLKKNYYNSRKGFG